MSDNLMRSYNVKIQVEQTGREGAGRIGFIDEMRGLLIILFVFYHLCYDLSEIYDAIDLEWFRSGWMNALQFCISLGFIVLSGISSNLSNRPYIRGLRVCACAALITLVTFFLFPSQIIKFGILHFLGVSMLLYAVFKEALSYVRPLTGCFAAFLLAAATWNIPMGYPMGYIGISPLSFPLPASVYTLSWLFPLGVVPPAFYSADYFPVFPYIFVFLFGVFIFKFIDTLPEYLYKEHLRPLAVLGRHSLLIYMLHQPILMGVLYLIFLFVK
ncbi:MAG: DUF1624 domain-containing protein [Clostridiales Family XIII bacterium]|nr:DUF1624 domain-containing protein [Clostridiales Family XIII bacterium]